MLTTIADSAALLLASMFMSAGTLVVSLRVVRALLAWRRRLALRMRVLVAAAYLPRRR